MSSARFVFCLLCVVVWTQVAFSDPTPDCGRYIIVMRDECNTQVEMDNVRRAMEVMSPGEMMLVTRELIPTVIGNMSRDAADMASNMRCVEYIECDQCVTRTDAVIDEDRRTRAVGQMVDTIPELVLEEFTYSPLITNLTGSGSGLETDRYNLDAIDEPCFGCNDGQYIPQYSGKGVKIYVLDTGIRNDHNDFLNPDLRRTRATFGGYDAIDEFENSNQRGVDCNGHGTHCSGIAVGRISGVAKEAEVRSIRVLNCNSFGGFAGIIRALDHVLQQHRRDIRRPVNEYKGTVVSMSLAGPVVLTANEAVCRLVAAGVVVVTASGNFRRDACNYSPGSAGCHINVGGHYYTERDTDTCVKDVYWFTSRTTSPGSNYGRCVHILAPGQYVVSASYLDRARTVSMSGTSMACPHVAGAAALLLDEFPRASPDAIKSLLIGGSCPDINERRMHPALRGQTPNRRLKVRRGLPDTGPETEPTTTPAPTTPAPTTTTPRPTIRPECTERCMFTTLANPAIKSRTVRIIPYTQYLGFLFRLSFTSRSSVIKKISTATDKDGNNPIWVIIEDELDSTSDYRFEIGPRFGSIGVPFGDIKNVAERYGSDFFVNTIIPFTDNKVFLLLERDNGCNNNQLIQVNYTLDPRRLIDPITIDNLLGDTATFDVSFTPGMNQFYAHNTLKRPHGEGCECQNTINLNNEQLREVRNIRITRSLVIADVNSYVVLGNVLFTITLCTEQCFTGRNCINRVVDNILVDEISEDSLELRISGMKEVNYEIVSLAPYYDEAMLKFVGVFIRFEY